LNTTVDLIAEIIKNHSRRDGIANKITFYQQRLDTPVTPLTAEESERLTNLITIFTAARTYQESMIHHLAKSPTSSNPRKEILQQSLRLSATMQLNERLNKIELLVEKLEQDYKNLSDYQASAQQRQNEIDAQPALIGLNTRRLTSINHLLNAITHQQFSH